MKINVKNILFSVVAAAFAQAAHATQLNIAGDLVVHPDQMGALLDNAVEKVKSGSEWTWDEVRFQQPYSTVWTGVRARGPFDIAISSRDLTSQEMSFELSWADPQISVDRFEIHDTVERDVGGVHIILRLNGECANVTVGIPGGQWRVKGRLGWSWGMSGPEVSWKDFQFSINSSATAQPTFGSCSGPSGLEPSLREALAVATRDPNWMRDVIRDGILEWVKSSLVGLRAELLTRRSLSLKPGLELAWEPSAVSGLPGGRVRIEGRFALKKGDGTDPDVNPTVERTYPTGSLEQAGETGFLLPKNAVQKVIDFVFRVGDLRRRTPSNQVESFTSLMQSRWMQFLVWPDLLYFKPSELFFFDVTTSRAPELTDGWMLAGGGVEYVLSAPLLVQQWALAPGGSRYVPYVDFTGGLAGRLRAKLADDKLELRVMPSSLAVTQNFRGEFASFRAVNTWMATSILGSRVQSYISETPVAIDVPQWDLSASWRLKVRDIQQWKQSFRVPLEFRSNK